MMIVDPHRFGGVQGPADIQFDAMYDTYTVAGNVATYTGVNFGVAATRRMILLAVYWQPATTGATITGASIGGIPAQIRHAFALGPDAGSNYHMSALVWAIVPSGTSGTVVLTFGASPGNQRFFNFRADNIASDTPHDTDSVSSTTSPTTALVDEVPDGIVIALGNTLLTSGPKSWAGITQAYDVADLFSGGCANTAAAASNIAIAMSDPGGPAGGPFRTVLAASFR